MKNPFQRDEKKDAARLEKEIKEGKKRLAKIQKAAKPVAPPPAVPIPAPAKGTVETQGEVTSLAEFVIGAKIGIELTRIKQGTALRIIVSKGMVQIKAGKIGVDPRKFLFFIVGHSAYYVNPKKIITVTTTKGKKTMTSYKLVYDVLYGEALDQDGRITWDDELELLLADSGLDQYVTIAAFEGGFQLTPTIKKVMMILGALGFFLGLAMNGAAHIVPTTIVHWIPVGQP